MSLFQSPQRDSGQGGEMSVAPGNSTLATPRNWTVLTHTEGRRMAYCKVINWRGGGMVMWQVYNPVIITGPKWKEFRVKHWMYPSVDSGSRSYSWWIWTIIIVDTSQLLKCKWTTVMILDRNMEAPAYPAYVWWSPWPPLIPLSARDWLIDWLK
jgi:hypothetical protein